MRYSMIPIIAALLLHPAVTFADIPRQISIRVVDEEGKPVEGATIKARYLEIIRQGDKEFPVPMELAAPQETDKQGRCKLTLQDAAWTLAGLYAHRVELTTDEVIQRIEEDAPKDPLKREAFDRELDDQCQRFRAAYLVLKPDREMDEPITLQLKRAVRVAGRVQVNGIPLAKAFVTIHSNKTDVDRLFPRSAPEFTDKDGKFRCYSFPGELDQARIVVERSDGNRVLQLRDVSSTETTDGKYYELDTDASDYTIVARPK